jgi:hypothetical protein
MRYQLWIEDEAKAEIKRLPGHMRQRIRRPYRGWATNRVPVIAAS